MSSHPLQGYLWTGQETCHDETGREVPCADSGQDAEQRRGLPWPSPRFEIAGETVLDRLTGLVWARDATSGEYPMTWQEALDAVKAWNRSCFLGFGDWRLPNRRELRSLISHQTRWPALPSGHPFVNVFAGWYWSATTAVISPAHAWYVDMDGGRMFYGGKDQSYLVWPVRGAGSGVLPVTGQDLCYDAAGRAVSCAGSGQDGERRLGQVWPSPRFEVRRGEVFDRLTGLIWRWEADAADGPVYWRVAFGCIESLNRAAGSATWRLPNINELESLVDCARHGPALAADHPFAAVRGVYGSSTTSLYEPDWAWALYLDKGAVGVGRKREARFHIWAVRPGA